MELIASGDIPEFLQETEIINFRNNKILAKIEEFNYMGKTKLERAKLAFNFVRDEIQHSFDVDSKFVSITALETLEHKEGICFAKAHLLAAFLRGMNIPAGFCYQRVTRKGTPESGYALHGFNAVWLNEMDSWFRVDPRGNKPGVYSEFSVSPEKLAYPIRVELKEIDYPYIFSSPLDSIIDSMKNSLDCNELFYKRPESI